MGERHIAGLPDVVTNKNDADDCLAKYAPNRGVKMYYSPVDFGMYTLKVAKACLY